MTQPDSNLLADGLMPGQLDTSGAATGRLAYSRLGSISFILALLAVALPSQLMLLLASGVAVSSSYAMACIIAGATCSVVGIGCAIAALFDRRKNRVLGLAGWWISLMAFSLLALSIRFALHHQLFNL